MRVLIVSVHPDDETLGCGGAMLRHQAENDELHWLIVTEAWEPQWDGDTIKQKAEEVRAVSDAYGITKVTKLRQPTAKLDTLDQNDLIRMIRSVVEVAMPEVIYSVHGGDIHTDHQVAFRALMSVVKPFYMASLGVQRVLCYETLSSTDAAPAFADRMFIPNVYRDVSPFLERKVEIMDLYGSEAHDDLMPRGADSIRALARHRGATIGVRYAEAFSLIREVG
jgi:N-acetylglucosamine malate deacetylase 1